LSVSTLFAYLTRYKRVILFGLVGGAVAVFGSVTLYLLIDVFHVEQNLAYFLQTVLALQANFNLNDRITWGDWRANNGSYWQRWVKYHLARIVTVGLCQLVFFILTVVAGVNHMVAFGINIAIGMIINYVTSDKFVFKKKE
jgi:putative flippase GtrA